MTPADAIQYAIDRLVSEYGDNTETASGGVQYVWKDDHKGVAATNDGFKYMRQGVVAFVDDNVVVVRAVVDNGINAGEARLTGFAAVSIELIAGAIETALESI
jgi:hypothetical protein